MTNYAVSAVAPTRVDIAGGTIDLWPIHQLLARKATVNIGISLNAECQIHANLPSGRIKLTSKDQKSERTYDWDELASQRDELYLLALLVKNVWSPDLPGISLTTVARSPAGAGLGGSSCLAVAVLSALFRLRHLCSGAAIPSEHQLVQTAQDIEARVIHAPTGCQDYWGGVRGGVNTLRFPAGGVVVETHTHQALSGLTKHLMVCFSGQSRQSAINNWDIFKRCFDGDQTLIATLGRIGEEAERCAEAVERGDVEAIIAASQAEWLLRTQLWPKIETPRTQAIAKAAAQSGARFSRVCGAGGGGMMLIFADPNDHAAITQAVAKEEGQIFPTVFAPQGVQVTQS